MLKKKKSANSSIGLKHILFETNILNDLGCRRVAIDNKIIWDDDMALESAWDLYKKYHPGWEKYAVTNIHIEIVEFHHCAINILVEKNGKWM